MEKHFLIEKATGRVRSWGYTSFSEADPDVYDVIVHTAILVPDISDQIWYFNHSTNEFQTNPLA
jgi:hypothetical protein